MLIQFGFKNFKSFKEEAALDLSATKVTEFANRVVKISNEKVLRVAAIYGANASGKSNIYSAFNYMHDYVINSFKYDSDENGISEKYRPTPFLLDKTSRDEESYFEVYFTLPQDVTGKMYNYGFCINKEGVSEEWLNYKAKTAREYSPIFYRNTSKGELDLTRIAVANRKNIEIALEKQELIISLGAKLKVEICQMVRNWFRNNELVSYADFNNSAGIEQYLPKGLLENKDAQHKVVNYLSLFDINLQGLEVKKLSNNCWLNEARYEISTLHRVADCEELVAIPLESESVGTLKLIALYFRIQQVLDEGSILVIDELDTHLHPLAVRYIIQMFINPGINLNNAQLIFTTHDVWQLSNNLLRRDEIWFVEKDNQGISKLYSLTNLEDEDGNKIRKDENFEKNYLTGKYGAIPILKRICMGKESYSTP